MLNATLCFVEGFIVAVAFRAYVQWKEKNENASDIAPKEEPTMWTAVLWEYYKILFVVLYFKYKNENITQA